MVWKAARSTAFETAASWVTMSSHSRPSSIIAITPAQLAPPGALQAGQDGLQIRGINVHRNLLDFRPRIPPHRYPAVIPDRRCPPPPGNNLITGQKGGTCFHPPGERTLEHTPLGGIMTELHRIGIAPVQARGP